jgi:hypothetical protein
MNRQTFFEAYRRKFGAMHQATVDGINALLDAGRDLPLQHMANVLAQVRRETGGWMAPIKETVMPWHDDKNPTDATVIRRLDAAFAKGQLKGVKAPYWRDGEFGRGQIQLTHKTNRMKFGIENRDDLLRAHISAMVAVRGMSEGLFRGKKLSDYDFPVSIHYSPDNNPRRIVNGNDGSDVEVAVSHKAFVAMLTAAEWGVAMDRVVLTPTAGPSRWAAFIAAIVALFK